MADIPFAVGLADILCSLGMLCFLLLGFCWFLKAGSLFENRTCVYTLCCLHFILIFLPWIVEVDCQGGSPWWSHLLYTAALSTASPVLGGYYVSEETGGPIRRFLYFLYLFLRTVITASDQYLDMATAAKAKACKSVYWSGMLVSFSISIVLQGTISALMVRRMVKLKKNKCSYGWIFFILVTAGMNPYNLVFFGELDEESLWLLVGVVAIIRFSTEALVELVLETAFALEQSLTGSNLLLVVTSVSVSAIVALASASTGLANLCGCTIFKRGEKYINDILALSTLPSQGVKSSPRSPTKEIHPPEDVPSVPLSVNRGVRLPETSPLSRLPQSEFLSPLTEEWTPSQSAPSTPYSPHAVDPGLSPSGCSSRSEDALGHRDAATLPGMPHLERPVYASIITPATSVSSNIRAPPGLPQDMNPQRGLPMPDQSPTPNCDSPSRRAPFGLPREVAQDADPNLEDSLRTRVTQSLSGLSPKSEHSTRRKCGSPLNANMVTPSGLPQNMDTLPGAPHIEQTPDSVENASKMSPPGLPAWSYLEK